MPWGAPISNDVNIVTTRQEVKSGLRHTYLGLNKRKSIPRHTIICESETMDSFSKHGHISTGCRKNTSGNLSQEFSVHCSACTRQLSFLFQSLQMGPAWPGCMWCSWVLVTDWTELSPALQCPNWHAQLHVTIAVLVSCHIVESSTSKIGYCAFCSVQLTLQCMCNIIIVQCGSFTDHASWMPVLHIWCSE